MGMSSFLPDEQFFLPFFLAAAAGKAAPFFRTALDEDR
jgi:hypothetical protein